MYHCKDLNHIAFSTSLWEKISNKSDLDKIKITFFNDLEDYYSKLGGLHNKDELIIRWGIPIKVEEEKQDIEIINFPESFDNCLPLLKATAGLLDLDCFSGDISEHQQWIKTPGYSIKDKMFAVQINGHSMEPKINDGDFCLFKAGDALAGSRQGRTVLVQHHSISDPDTTNQFTVKQYFSEKVFDEFGVPQHTKIILKPLNPDYEPINIEDVEEEKEFMVVGEFVEILDPTNTTKEVEPKKSLENYTQQRD
jgi:SOS-response transcriptional repressor LexA